MSDPLAASFDQAFENHLRDALAMTHAQRWRWLEQAMDLGFAVVRLRARQGLPSLDAHGVPLGGQEDAGIGTEAADEERALVHARK